MRSSIAKICFSLITLGFAFSVKPVIAATVVSAARAEIGWSETAWVISVKSDEPWTASTEAGWLSIATAEGVSDRDLEIVVQPNLGREARTATVSIGGQVLTLTQKGRLADDAGDTASVSRAAVIDQRAEAAAVYGDTFYPDPSFSVRVETTGGEAKALAKTPDGGYVVGGNFSSVDGVPRRGLVKFRADGGIDTAFNAGVGFNGQVHAVAVQADGRILVGGIFSRFNGESVPSLVRLNADGTRDVTFFPEIDVSGGTVYALTLQADGKILVGGRYAEDGSGQYKIIDRLNANGTRDTGFTAGFMTGAGEIYAVTLQADGRILVGGQFLSYAGAARGQMARLSASGVLDTTFNPGTGYQSNAVYAIAVQADGKIMVGGHFRWEFFVSSYFALVRLNADGSHDSTFSTNHSWSSEVHAIVVQPDGQIVTGGNIGGPTILRRRSTGIADHLFSPSAAFNDTVHAIAIQADGRILAAGQFSRFANGAAGGVARLSSTGTMDSAPALRLRTTGGVSNVLPVDGGKFLIAGYFDWVNGMARGGIARLLSDGSLDAGFTTGSGFQLTSTPTPGAEAGVTSLAVQADGRILAGGDFLFYNGALVPGLVRLNTDGGRDTAYAAGTGLSDEVYTIALRPDGQSLVGGDFTPDYRNLQRFTTGGSSVSGFTRGTFSGSSHVNIVATQADGLFFAGGTFTSHNGITRRLVARFNADGTLESTFNPQNLTGSHVNTLVVQPDGKLLAGGDFSWPEGSNHSHIGRLTATGGVDSGFNVGYGFDGEVFALALQEDGRVVAGGFFDSYNLNWRARLARLNTDGSLDARFAVSGLAGGAVFQVNLLGDGRMLLAGPVASNNGVLQAGVVMLKPGTDVVPYFTTQPVGASVNAGATVTLTGAASGVPAPTYQWFKDGVELSGQTSATLTLSNVNATHAGSYFVLALNSLDAYAMSNTVTVAVATPPSPPANSGGGGSGGGGGAPSYGYWFALFAAIAVRMRLVMRRT